MQKPLLVCLLILVLVAAWMIRRSYWESKDAGAPPIEHVLARERVAAHFERGSLELAREALAPLLAVPEPALEDLVRAAAVDFSDRANSDPGPFLERIRAVDPDDPALRYMSARLSLEAGEFETAIEHFRTVLRRVPGDLPSQVGLAMTLEDLGRTSEAEELLREIVAGGIDHGGVWYVQSVYRLGRLLWAEERKEDAQHFDELYSQLRELGFAGASAAQLDQGSLAGVLAPRPMRPTGSGTTKPAGAPSFEREEPILPELASARELLAEDVDDDGDVDFIAAGAGGVVCALRTRDGYRIERVLSEAVDHVRAFDLGNDDSLDLLVCRGGELLLFEAASGADLLELGGPGSGAPSGTWSRSPLELAPLPAPPEDLVFADIDHEGDLDLLIVGPFGARLLRNDGAAPRTGADGAETRGAFVDVSREASLPRDVPLTWCATEDVDGDQDVDLLLGGPNALYLMDSLRAGGFEDVAGRVFAGATGMGREPLLADFDGDARVDLLEPGDPATLWIQREDGSLEARTTEHGIGPEAHPFTLDLDLDGTLDLFWGGRGALALGQPQELDVEVALLAGEGPLAAGDFDGDLDHDLARSTAEGIEILRCGGPVGRAARLEPLGLKDNRRAVGAVVEVRSRELYRRIYWRGGADLVGSGPYDAIDVVRITWPNGVVQTNLDVQSTDQPFIDSGGGPLEQSTALGGSCPFLYTWNGSTYEFISDVLGITPLGLPMAPGVLVPPDHDEYVLVLDEQLVPRDGWLEMQFTEELREVTYLDRIRLDVVDHPQGTEIHPTERFTFPPFPQHHVHTVREPLLPLSARGCRGQDWTAELARIDDVHAVPFEPLESQFLGLATPHWLELTFDPERVRGAERLRLLCTGWFYWTDASVNMAAARTPGVDFVPPILQVPDSAGGWVDAGPPLGFPAGKTKTMVVDVTDLVNRSDPRLRLFSTLRLYWDSVRLAVDGDDAPLAITSLEPVSAELWPRGFSRLIETGRGDLPERFEWGVLSEHKRWNQHPGMYTRYGETVPLLHDVDDRFVIMGSGDALRVRFDAGALPDLPQGWRRDYLVFLDGWAKDRDPNTVEALEVEPLPFHGMSAYPYGADEAFPADALHQAWREEWNTRPERAWIPPLSPRREAQWVLREGRTP